MHIDLLDRSAEAFQQSIPVEQLLALCARAFGLACSVTAIHELGGGTINNVYRITRAAQPPVILRVAPSAAHPDGFRHERHLLRREFFVQPFLAPVGHLLPSVVMVDFTQQLIARDYMFQSYIDGELWRDVHRNLLHGEQAALWHQLGLITRHIHTVEHDAFGPPDPAPPFPRWSDSLVADFAGIVQDIERWGIPPPHFHTIAAYIARHRDVFDAVGVPRLLHGDLWLNNVLIQRSPEGPMIVGVLDAGFAQWGDPIADWTIMRMTMAPPQGSEPFWEAYGARAHERGADIRAAVYQARSIAFSLLELQRMRHADTAWLWSKLEEINVTLQEGE